MNRIGFGTWKLPVGEAPAIVREALSAGFRRIDTAAAYANEAAVGEGIAASGVARAELFVSGKLWVTRRAYPKAVAACKKSLKTLGLAYFDQYLIHWPATAALYDNWPEINAETWRAMEALQREGLARSIGVCNFKKHHLAALLSGASTPPAVDQIEFHPGFAQEETVAYCKARGIAVEAWSPLGNGALLDHPALLEIAAAHGRSAAQVCLRWCLECGVLPVTKTVSAARMRENLDSLGFRLSPNEVARIDALPPCAFSGLDADVMTRFG
jgi:diketogulonate reductase-like aldo/keto reductase